MAAPLNIATLPSPLVLADTTQPGLIRPLSGNATDLLDGTGNFTDLANAVYGNRRQLIFYDDFSYYFSTANATNGTTINGIWYAYAANSPTGIVASTTGADAFNKAWGVWLTNLSTPANGISGCYMPQGFMAGLGPLDMFFRVAFPLIPAAGASDTMVGGFGLTGLSGGLPVPTTNCIIIQPALAASTTGWWGACYSATNPISTNTSPPSIVSLSSTALTFYNLQISINAAWTSVSFWVNGTPLGQNNIALGTLTSFIPNNVVLSPIAFAQKTGGTTTGFGFYLDKFFMRYQMGGV